MGTVGWSMAQSKGEFLRTQAYVDIVKRFSAHLSPRRHRQLLLLLVLMVVGSMAELVTIGAVVPFVTLMARPELASEWPLLGQGFALLGWQRSDELVFPMTVAFVAVVLFATALRFVLVYVANKVTFAIGHDLSVRLYQRILHQPYVYHINKNTSETISGVNKAQVLLSALLNPLMQGLTALLMSLGVLVALLWVSPTTALMAGVVFTALYWLIIEGFRLTLESNSVLIAKAQDDRIKNLQEGLGGIRDVILDHNQDHYLNTFAHSDNVLKQAQVTNSFLTQSPRFAVETLAVFLMVGMAWMMMGRSGGLIGALPMLGALAFGAARLLPLIQQVFAAWASFTGNVRVMQDVLELLDLPMAETRMVTRDATRHHPERNERLPFNHTIEFRGVSFSYRAELPWVIQDLSFCIPKGARVGIVGKTGSGKSTLMDLLLGLLKPTQGCVLVDGVELNSANHQAWQSRIAHVPQHIYLSDTSVAENIALGHDFSEIDWDLVNRAAQQAQIAEFIEGLEQGYGTKVGERGIRLSGGQRQRIGIARALYKAADVLVFDEASSALDMETEQAVMGAVNGLDPQLTIVMIAHRVQTLAGCDVLLRLDKGRLVAMGSYREVIHEEPSSLSRTTP
jgi:ABC-type multidrug transport system fused ATPase/permease subunit